MIARILGARHLAQAILSGASPSAEVLATGVWVDVAHAGTAVALAAADRSRARAGITDGAIAGTFAGLGYHDLTTSGLHTLSHDRRRDSLARLVLRRVPARPRLLRAAPGRNRAA